MNNGQRAHMNFVEWVTSSLFFLLVAGLYCPCTATILGVVMIVARMIYAIGYVSGGPNGRRIGAILNDLAVLGLFVMAVMYSVHLICPCGEKAPSADL
jgi:glutathione S-transferase